MFWKPIRFAVFYRHKNIVQLLLQNIRVDPCVDSNVCICTACENGDVEIVELLLQDPRVTPNARCMWALMKACERGHHEVIRVLLQDPRTNLGSYIQKLLMIAIRKGHKNIVMVLLQYSGPKWSGEGLIDAAEYDEYDIVEMMVNDPRFNDENIEDAIIEAAKKDNLEIVKLLLTTLKRQPRLNNSHAIWGAAENGYTEIVKVLLDDKRFDPSALDNIAIKTASRNGYSDVVNVLLQDERVNGTDAISEATMNVADILIADSRFGYHVNTHLFNKHHPHVVAKYKRNIKQTGKIIRDIHPEFKYTSDQITKYL